MWLRLRQICLVAHDIERVTNELTSIFGLEVCYVDPEVGKYGLVNRLLPIGNQFLEIVAPTEAGTAAGRYLERRGGDGGYMVITQCPEHGDLEQRLAGLDVRIANRIEHDGFHGMQLHPKDTGGAFFEIDVQDGDQAPDGPWTPAGPHWARHVRTEVVDAIAGAELQSPDPQALGARWAAIAGLPLESTVGAGGAKMSLDDAEVRFVPVADGRGEGLAGIDLRAVDAKGALERAQTAGCPVSGSTITICGTRFHLV